MHALNDPIEPPAKAPQEDSETPVTNPSQVSQTIPVVEEAVSVSRVREESGAAVRVRVRSREEKERIVLTDAFEEVTVKRVPINRFVSERSAPREEGEVVVVPVYESVAVVEMRLLLKEEVHLVRRRREVAREEEVVLRKETAVVERKDAEQGDWRE